MTNEEIEKLAEWKNRAEGTEDLVWALWLLLREKVDEPLGDHILEVQERLLSEGGRTAFKHLLLARNENIVSLPTPPQTEKLKGEG
jgi:hypothetical protein